MRDRRSLAVLGHAQFLICGTAQLRTVVFPCFQSSSTACHACQKNSSAC
jgi:hypothetical protein